MARELENQTPAPKKAPKAPLQSEVFNLGNNMIWVCQFMVRPQFIVVLQYDDKAMHFLHPSVPSLEVSFLWEIPRPSHHRFQYLT